MPRPTSAWLLGGLLLTTAAALPAGERADAAYLREVEEFRRLSEERLKAPTGWLAVAGLHWLKEGSNRIGANEEFEVPLPAGPKQAGTLEFRGGKATLRPAADAGLLVNGKAVSGEVALASDENNAKPDLVTVNERVSFFVIKRGQRHAVRLRDTESEMRRSFTGKTWFPVDAKWRVTADWTAYAEPKSAAFPNILGEVEEQPVPGKATFTVDGQTVTLEPVLEGGRLFFLFRDGTAGKETYTPGRYLYADLPQDGKVVIDFNKAYNPPCVFTPYATCMRPIEGNKFALRVTAGELKYGH